MFWSAEDKLFCWQGGLKNIVSRLFSEQILSSFTTSPAEFKWKPSNSITTKLDKHEQKGMKDERGEEQEGFEVANIQAAWMIGV